MPKETGLEGKIPKIYKQNAFNLLMFGFIRGCIATLYTMSVKDAIDLFVTTFRVDEDDINRQSIEATYRRMLKELIEDSKNKISNG